MIIRFRKKYTPAQVEAVQKLLARKNIRCSRQDLVPGRLFVHDVGAEKQAVHQTVQQALSKAKAIENISPTEMSVPDSIAFHMA